MPIYEFKCKKCGNVFEQLCFASDDQEHMPCPTCGGKKSERLLSTFSSTSSGSSQGFGNLASASSCSSSGGFS